MAGKRGSLVRGAVLGGVVALSVLLVWVAVTGLLALRSAAELRSQTDELARQMGRGDVGGAEQSLDDVRSSSAALAATLNSPPWQQVAALPLVGPSVTVFAGIAEGTAAASAATAGQEDVIIGSMAALKDRGAAGAGALTELQPVAAAAADAIESPARRVAGVQADQIFGPLRQVTLTQQQEFLAVARGITAFRGASVALPIILGTQGPRTWLVAVQNDAEPRGTGGLLSAYAVAEVRQGRIRAEQTDTTNTLFRSPEVSLRGIPADTRRLWGQGQLGRWWGFNLDRHFPYAALLMSRGSPRPVDDIVTIDARVVAGLLAVTGPVSAEGVRIDSENAAQYFTTGIYADFPDPARKDAVTVALIGKLLERLADRDLDPIDLWQALGQQAGEGRLLIASTDPTAQAALELMPTGGAVPTDPGPWASAAVNDYAGNKLGAYLQVAADYRSAAFCADPATASTVTMTLTNRSPRGLPSYVDVRSDLPGSPTREGSSKLGVAIYGPAGATMTTAWVDGVPTTPRIGSDRGHPVWQTTVELARGGTAEVRVEFREPRSEPTAVAWSAQPMVQDMAVTTAAAC